MRRTASTAHSCLVVLSSLYGPPLPSLGAILPSERYEVCEAIEVDVEHGSQLLEQHIARGAVRAGWPPQLLEHAAQVMCGESGQRK